MYRRKVASPTTCSSDDHVNNMDDHDSAASKAEKTKRQLVVTVSVLSIIAFVVLHFASPTTTSLNPTHTWNTYLSNRLSKSKSTASRRTDSHLRYDRSRKSAASSQGSAYPPANFSQAPPFTFCPTFGSSDELSHIYGPDAILKTRSHLGNTERIRKVLRRAIHGLPITIGVLGGSISSCHGLDGTPNHPLGDPISPACYPHRVFGWLNDVFPHPANELTNGALRRTGTSYFSFCNEQHLPDRVDLVIVEFDTEDPHEIGTLASTDLLIRSLLLRPDQPAVIVLGHFAPQIQGEHGYAGPEMYHSAVAQFYDVPHLSVKGLLYEKYLQDPDTVRNTYFLDPILANAKGHELLADTIIAYLESETCLVWEAEGYGAGALDAFAGSRFGGSAVGSIALPGGEDAPPSLLGGKGLRKSSDAGLDGEDGNLLQNAGQDKGGHKKANDASTSASRAAGIPPFRIMDRPHTISSFREIKPFCASANDLINPLPSSVFSGTGWEPVAPKPDDEDERHYWFSDTPGSLLKIPIKVVSGDVAVYYYRGPASEGWGSVFCWVDDNVAGRLELRGSWDRDYGQPTVTQIDRGVSKGPHFLACELKQPQSGNTQFKIFGAFAT